MNIKISACWDCPMERCEDEERAYDRFECRLPDSSTEYESTNSVRETTVLPNCPLRESRLTLTYEETKP